MTIAPTEDTSSESSPKSRFDQLITDPKGNKISKIHDDLLSNGSSFAKDIDVILNNSDVVKHIVPTPSTPLTENHMHTIKEMIIELNSNVIKIDKKTPKINPIIFFFIIFPSVNNNYFESLLEI